MGTITKDWSALLTDVHRHRFTIIGSQAFSLYAIGVGQGVCTNGLNQFIGDVGRKVDRTDGLFVR